MEPFERQRLLAKVAVIDLSCSVEQRSHSPSDHELTAECWEEFSYLAEHLPSLDDSNLLADGPLYAYAHEQTFLLAIELTNLRRAGSYEFPNGHAFERFAAAQEDSWKAASAIYTRLIQVNDPELYAKYSSRYAAFLRNSIAALRAQGSSVRLQEARHQLGSLPKHIQEMQTPPSQVARLVWTPYFS